MGLDSKIPKKGELGEKWTKYRSTMNLVAPNNKRRIDVIVVGTGLAGASAAATLGELGYNVKAFCQSTIQFKRLLPTLSIYILRKQKNY